MSTVQAVNFKHPSATTAAITLDSTGAMTGSFPYPNRNLLYNGAMQVHQRGTSTTGINTGSYYTADRWTTAITSLGTWTQTLENDAPTGSGFRKSVKMLCTTANASPSGETLAAFLQYLEGQDLQRVRKGTASAQQLTLSFWVKSNKTGTYVAELYDVDNTRSISASYSVSASATWEFKTVTFASDTTGLWDNDNASSVGVVFWLAAGSGFTSGSLATSWASATSANRAVGQTNLAAATNNYWQITGVQLETGPVATPFEFKSYGQELRECQRYCIRYDLSGTAALISGFAYSTTGTVFGLPLTVPMRTTPTIYSFSNLGITDYVSNFTVTSLVLSEASLTSVRLLPSVASGLTQYRPYMLRGDGNAAANITIAAEL